MLINTGWFVVCLFWMGILIARPCCSTAHSSQAPFDLSGGGGELGHGLGALRHGVLGQLAGQDEAHGGLDLARRHRRLLVVARQAGGLGGDLLEDVVDERVHDGHGLRRDARVGVHLKGRERGNARSVNLNRRRQKGSCF